MHLEFYFQQSFQNRSSVLSFVSLSLSLSFLCSPSLFNRFVTSNAIMMVKNY